MFNEQMNCIQKHPDFISPLLSTTESYKQRHNRNLIASAKENLEDIGQNCDNFFTVSDFYCSFILFSELSNAALLFVQLIVLVLSLIFSLLFLGEQKSLSKRLKGLKEEVKAGLFLATIPLAENTAAVEMRKQLIGITGYHVSTAALSCRAMQESNLNHALICACSWESPSSLKALPVPWVMVKLPASDCSADPGDECDEGLGSHTESQFRECPSPGGSFKE